ncbi:MAG: fumarylacetoacetate hydrolase family protein [Bacteroidetes bacterium]|nr:fumarylacetoacetate hydrolase family protein [Bacteroidota bacterium]MBS1974380.1 fumarylacetoacetate hydrolase family protein [Bacteroidota bacterium]
MKLVSYLNEGHDQLAILVDGLLYDTELIHPDLPNSINLFLNYWEDFLPMAQAAQIAIEQGNISREKGIPMASVDIIAPVPFPSSCRDGYAFHQHVATARRNRGAKMIPEFDQYPVFYFTNHHSITGQGAIKCMPDHFEKLDFELEAAIVISKHGRNIRAEDADGHIAGLMILNDFSARRLQMEEMLLNLGPAKGKDFATATGPCLVTLDELQPFEMPCKDGHIGKNWSLRMQCRVNGKQVSDGNLKDMDWTFAEIIERASYGADLYPGDIIGSGTVGTGCFLELNGTAKLNDADYEEQWLKEGDEIELEIDGLGILKNTIVREEDDFSILGRKINREG